MIIKGFRHLLTRIIVGVNYFVLLGFLSRTLTHEISPSKINAIKTSGLYGVSGINTDQMYDQWGAAEDLWNKGEYFKSTELRRSVMEKVYAFHGTNMEEYFPQNLSPEFTSAFGHLGLTGLILEAQRENIIPSGTRNFFRMPVSDDWAVLDALKLSLQELPYRSGVGWTEIPVNWHIVEKLQMIRTHETFIDTYALLEKTYSNRVINRENPIITLPKKYSENARATLEELGINSSDWFISLHVRNDGREGGRRNQGVETYLRAIKHICDLGGKIVRIGDRTRASLVDIPGVLDLTERPDLRWIHTYILATAKFHLGTTSGPTWIAPLFGVPTIQTNATSIGRNSHTMSEHSFSVPKILVVDNEKVNFARYLESPEAYSEIDLKYSGLQAVYLNNSEEDILDAVKEMLSRITNEHKNENIYQNTVNSIRKNQNAVGFGEL